MRLYMGRGNATTFERRAMARNEFIPSVFGLIERRIIAMTCGGEWKLSPGASSNDIAEYSSKHIRPVKTLNWADESRMKMLDGLDYRKRV